MNDNTFWILFWGIVSVYWLSTTYFQEQTKQIEIKTNLEILKMQNTSDKEFHNTMTQMVNTIKDIKGQ